MKGLHRLAVLSAILGPSLALFPAAMAQEQKTPAAQPGPSQAAPAATEPHKDADKENAPVPPEKPVATHHEMTLDGKSLKYTATAGNLIIRDEDE
jgi:carboxypeptidase C (cathepsin A)